jgi:hypothetical protein
MYGDNLCDGGLTRWKAAPDSITKQPILCGTTGPVDKKVDTQVGYFGYE